MELRERLQKLATVAATDLRTSSKRTLILRDRARLLFINESFTNIRHPANHECSFHWRRAKEVYRINTAPDRPEIKTFPRHIRAGREEDVKPDTITSLDNPPEENLRRILKWIRKNSA